MKVILETERLILREFTLSDCAFILRLLNSPGWIEFIGDRNVHTNQDARNYLLNGPLKSSAENGFGLWIAESRAGSLAIGICGILKRTELQNPDIGFAFLPEFTGMGYAFEVAFATLRYAKEQLNITELLAITLSHNIRSISLLKKIGLHYQQPYLLPGENSPLQLFSTLPGQ